MERKKQMVIKNVNLETVCGITSTFPDNPYYEVAFAGKSNVGKSSLINALVNRKALARTSSQPGKTQTINFYNINNAMYLVDLPGYGYANANVEIKAKWGKMIERYLHTSKKLKAVFLLIDIRHEPSENDCLMYEWMVNQGFAPIIIATKMDKISRGAVPKHINIIKKTLNVEPDTLIIPFSASTKQGREEVWELIDSFVLPEEVLDMKNKMDSNVSNALNHIELNNKIEKENVQSVDNTEQSSDIMYSEQNLKDVGNTDEPEKKQRKPRWKSEGKTPAKKTLKMQEKKAVKKAKNNIKKRK
ncbi:MAG: YihA family ribosome biogenesis GTP-binding protein [Lachnospiraceae bacterium]|nr:YihA family ribosome biogenesis GTP-binding protein [Lachnospiraceae bacterium]